VENVGLENAVVYQHPATVTLLLSAKSANSFNRVRYSLKIETASESPMSPWQGTVLPLHNRPTSQSSRQRGLPLVTLVKLESMIAYKAGMETA
jgi:hypothetical protein